MKNPPVSEIPGPLGDVLRLMMEALKTPDEETRRKIAEEIKALCVKEEAA